MAKMIGDLIREKTGYQDTHRAFKNDEDRVWKREAEEEIYDPYHANVLCSNPKTGLAGCEWCYPSVDDWNSGHPGDLKNIQGVTTTMKD